MRYLSAGDAFLPHLPVGETLQEVGLAAAVGADQAVAPPDRELDRAVLDQRFNGLHLYSR